MRLIPCGFARMSRDDRRVQPCRSRMPKPAGVPADGRTGFTRALVHAGALAKRRSLPECLLDGRTGFTPWYVPVRSPSAGACRSACLTVEPGSPVPWYVPACRQAPEPAGARAWLTRRHRASLRPLPEPAGISMPPASPAGVAIRLPVRQSGVHRRNQTVGIRVGTAIPAMAESCAYSVSYANSARTGPARNGPKVRTRTVRAGRPCLGGTRRSRRSRHPSS